MSNAVIPPAPVAPPVAAPVVPPTPAPVAAPVAAPGAAPPSQSVSPDWLNGRIAQAKQSERADLLKSLGVNTPEEAKAAIDAAKKVADANKTAEQRATDLGVQLAAEQAKTKQYEATLVARAKNELATLTEPQRLAVEALAGDDAGAQLLAIDTLRPTWGGASAPVAAPVAGAPRVAAPASTTAAPAAPATNIVPPTPTDHAAVYDELKTRNPMAAANFYSAYHDQIAAARAAKRAAT